MQDVLNNVPGLIVRQHQGGGKATQYLIRGFNADHGTDFLVTLDGLPVNLVTHAPRPGLRRLELHHPGDDRDAAAPQGAVLPRAGRPRGRGRAQPRHQGRRSTRTSSWPRAARSTACATSPACRRSSARVQTLLAGQAYYSNGPFIHDEHFARYNALREAHASSRRPTRGSGPRRPSTPADWDASGQIPQREVSAGRLDRFGSLDPTEGGRTDRENLDLHYDWKPNAGGHLVVPGLRQPLQAPPVVGLHLLPGHRAPLLRDARRRDRRHAAAADTAPSRGRSPATASSRTTSAGSSAAAAATQRAYELAVPMATRIGVETRNDDIDVAVYRQVRRSRFFTVSKVNVAERSVSGYLSQQIVLHRLAPLRGRAPRRRLQLRREQPALPPASGSRLRQPCPIDGADDGLDRQPQGEPHHHAGAEHRRLPELRHRLSLQRRPRRHPGASRRATRTSCRSPARSATRSAAGRGKFDRIDAAAALWLLDLDSEVVFCGDCGTIERNATGSFEPGRAARAAGASTSRRGYELARWLYADYDLSYADPRFKRSGEAIPVAPTLFMNGGLTAEFRNGFSAAFRARFLDDRPGNEDRTIPARGYFIMDLLAKYRWRNVEASLAFLNLADFDWQEAVFVDTSCTRRAGRRTRTVSEPRADPLHAGRSVRRPRGR